MKKQKNHQYKKQSQRPIKPSGCDCHKGNEKQRKENQQKAELPMPRVDL